jgi:hypothetical protein
MKKIIFLLLLFPLLSSCYEDKGSYDYHNLAEITIENVPKEFEVLSHLDTINVTPKITSSEEGEIKADNTNFTFKYRLGYKGMGSLGGVVDGVQKSWIDVTPKSGLSLSLPITYAPGSYLCWFTVKDTRTNVETSKFFDIKVGSTTYEGWLVLCNEGAEERVRLDMISLLSSTNIRTLHDISNGLPTIHHATMLGFHPMQSTGGDEISIMSKEGSYNLDNSTFESSEDKEFNINQFFELPKAETMISFTTMSAQYDAAWRERLSFVVSDVGNVYCKTHGEGGAAYGLPINTAIAGGDPQYKVAPYVGCSQVRPSNANYAILYDMTGKRFVGFSAATCNRLSTIPDPDNKLFSYTTGRDMVYMEGTRRSNGDVFAILQDAAGQRSIYTINMGGNGFLQEAIDENISAPDFESATLFAFSSKYPVMFYSTGKKVYLYNLGSKTAYLMSDITLGTNEEVTCLKFNLFRNSRLTSLNKQTDEFMNQQFQLIVGSYDSSVTGNNGGKVRLYEVNGQNNSVSKVAEYSGFAKVKDVVYRERANE